MKMMWRMELHDLRNKIQHYVGTIC